MIRCVVWGAVRAGFACLETAYEPLAGTPRAPPQTLPPKNPAHVPKSSKFQMDRSMFLSDQGSSIVGNQNRGASRRSFEMPTNPKLVRAVATSLATRCYPAVG